MEDKQIIIHGVDVSRCMFFNEEYEEDDIQIKNFCEWQFVPCQEFDCAKCYFKNWKRKEQECEKLKKGLNLILTVQKNCKECPHQKLDVDVLVCDLDCATAFKKIAKQTLKKLENKNV